MTTATGSPFASDIARGCRTALAAWRDDLRERADEGDTAAKARLEFCEVQEELASQEHQQCRAACSSRIDYRCQWCALKAREAALFREHEASWRASGPCIYCQGRGRSSACDEPNINGVLICPSCYSTGDCGGLLRMPPAVLRDEGDDLPAIRYSHKIHWRAGLPYAIECRLGNVLERVPRDPRLDLNNLLEYRPSQSEWRVTEWAKSVVRWHPVERFVLTDREPGKSSGGPADWYKDAGRDYYSRTPYHLPDPLFDALEGGHLRANGRAWGVDLFYRLYPSVQSSKDALATAAGVLVRRAVWDTDQIGRKS